MTLWLLGCWGPPSVHALSEGGIQVDLPDGFVALAPEALAEVRAQAEAQAPGQQHAVTAARRGARGAAGFVQLQHSVEPDAARYGATVGAVLEALGSQGETALRDGGREVCATLDGEEGVVRSCALVTVDPERQLHVRAITCRAPEAAVCDRPMASRRYSPGETLPLDVRLVPLGALPRSGRAVWGFTFGSSREAFRAACAAAGHAVDAYDWATEPAVVRTWFDAGRASRCAGTPEAPTIGPVAAVSATFSHDVLTGLTVFFEADPNGIEAVLAEAYPVAVAGEDQILHVIDESAIDDEVQSVTLFGMAGATSLSFLSERGTRPQEPVP